MAEYIDPETLADLDDEVGDAHRLSYVVDSENRDGVFVVLDGDVVVEYDGSLDHVDVVRSMLGLDADAELERWEIASQGDKVAFGSLIGSVGLLEVCSGYSAQEVVVMLNANGVDKVYDYDYANDDVVRLACRRVHAPTLRLSAV